MAESVSVEDQEKRRRDLGKEIKRDLEGWREVILPLHSILLWEKNWYPWMLITFTSCGFLLFWYLDPTVLTTISMIGLTVTLVDYLVPTLTASLCQPDSWTGVKERKLEEISTAIADIIQKFSLYVNKFHDMRQSRSTAYFGAVVITLGCLAWLGNQINNLLLTYLIVTTLILLPGIRHHGTLTKSLNELQRFVTNPFSSLNDLQRFVTKPLLKGKPKRQ